MCPQTSLMPHVSRTCPALRAYPSSEPLHKKTQRPIHVPQACCRLQMLRDCPALCRPPPPGEPLPEELYSRIKAAKNYRSGTMMLRQLHFSCVDLELHARFKPGGCAVGVEVAGYMFLHACTHLRHVPKQTSGCARASSRVGARGGRRCVLHTSHVCTAATARTLRDQWVSTCVGGLLACMSKCAPLHAHGQQRRPCTHAAPAAAAFTHVSCRADEWPGPLCPAPADTNLV